MFTLKIELNPNEEKSNGFDATYGSNSKNDTKNLIEKKYFKYERLDN